MNKDFFDQKIEIDDDAPIWGDEEMNDAGTEIDDTGAEVEDSGMEGKDHGTVIRDEYISSDRKKGAGRFFELLGRSFGTIYATSFFFLLGVLPGFVLMYFSIMAEALIGAIAGGLLAGLAGAPLLCGMMDTLLRMMRDEAGLWWHNYKKAWKQNWKQSLMPGAVLGAFAGIWCWIIIHIPDMENVPIAVWCCLVLGAVFLMLLILYISAQIVLINLPTSGILKNAGLFIGGYFPRSFLAGVISAGYWAVTFLYMPYTVISLMILGAWLPVMISLLLIYPILNSALHIEADIQKLNEQKYTETL